jgi:hypothetical protein
MVRGLLAIFTVALGLGLTPGQVHIETQGLAKAVHGTVQPAEPLPPEPEPGLGGWPEHLRFSFDGDKLHDYISSEQRQIVIYPAPAYSELFRKAGLAKQDPVPALRALLGKPGGIKGEIPILPLADAVQILKARVDLLKFKGGKGLRFLTHYAQDDVPVTNASLFYTYQGLTDDGRYWVAVYYPVAASVLPKTIDDSPESKDFAVLARHYDAYLKKTVKKLDDPKVVFTPDLATLDAMVESIEIRR